MQTLRQAVDEEAERSGFSGAVRLERAGVQELSAAYGFADRAHRVPNTDRTRFATASGSKALTALAVMRLVEDGVLALDTTARSVLGGDLPLVADDVTVEHLLAHRSGIGDYLDEESISDITAHLMPVSVHRLAETEDFLTVLDGHETAFPAGERYAYNNGGYVLLALIAERATGTGYHRLVETLVCQPAGMADTAFLRSDELPGDAARGYLHAKGLRTNVFHLPVLGSGDGGIYSTVADLSAFWSSLFAGRIVRPETLATMLRPQSVPEPAAERHGLGFQLDPTGDAVWLEGYDAGVSFASRHDPSSATTWTVVSNWSDGAWPIVRLLSRRDEFASRAP